MRIYCRCFTHTSDVWHEMCLFARSSGTAWNERCWLVCFSLFTILWVNNITHPCSAVCFYLSPRFACVRPSFGRSPVIASVCPLLPVLAAGYMIDLLRLKESLDSINQSFGDWIQAHLMVWSLRSVFWWNGQSYNMPGVLVIFYIFSGQESTVHICWPAFERVFEWLLGLPCGHRHNRGSVWWH